MYRVRAVKAWLKRTKRRRKKRKTKKKKKKEEEEPDANLAYIIYSL